MFVKVCPFYFKKQYMKKQPKQCVSIAKTIEILGTYRTYFYMEYADRLKEHALQHPTDKRKVLYPLDKVLEIRAELDAKKAKVEILG